MKGIFITGVTGNLGSRLAYEYLTQTDAELHLLVRAGSLVAAEQRVAQALEFWGIQSTEYRDRIHVYCGDIVHPDLGLDATACAQIAARVSVVVHSASNLRLDLSWEKAQTHIVGATRSVFALFESCAQPERFVYVSTMEIMGRYAGVVTEEFLSDLPIDFLNTYERGKFETEKYLQKCLQAGAPITIIRPSMIVGEAKTGRVPGFQSFYMAFEKLVLKPDFPVLPRGVLIDMIPVDFLAQCMVRLLQVPESIGRIYHLSQGLEDRHALAEYEKIVAPALQKFGCAPGPRCFIWAGWHRGVLRLLTHLTWGKARRFFRVQLIFLEFFDLKWQFDNRRTKEDMRRLGLEWPQAKDYLPRLIEYYLQHRHENRFPF